MADCPKLNGAPDNRSDEDKLRDCQECEYYKAEYGVYFCKYHDIKEETE